jgi:hypothetical protein
LQDWDYVSYHINSTLKYCYDTRMVDALELSTLKTRRSEKYPQSNMFGFAESLGRSIRQERFWVNLIMKYFHHDFNSSSVGLNYFNCECLRQKLVALASLHENATVMPRLSEDQVLVLRKKSSALLSGDR